MIDRLKLPRLATYYINPKCHIKILAWAGGGITLGNAQESFLAPYSGITPGGIWDIIWDAED